MISKIYKASSLKGCKFILSPLGAAATRPAQRAVCHRQWFVDPLSGLERASVRRHSHTGVRMLDRSQTWLHFGSANFCLEFLKDWKSVILGGLAELCQTADFLLGEVLVQV